MKGIILHGGHGTRLRPLTHTGPKQLLPIANKPMSQYCLEALKKSGITEIAIIIGGIGAQRVKEYYEDGIKFGVNITYLEQDSPRGIAHAIRLCKNFVEEEKFLVFLGDNILNRGLGDIVKNFEKSDAKASILLSKVENPTRFGIADVKNGKIMKIMEKPKHPPSNLAVTGIYFLTPLIFDIIDKLKPSWRNELEITDALQLLLQKGYKITYLIKMSIYLIWTKLKFLPIPKKNKLLLELYQKADVVISCSGGRLGGKKFSTIYDTLIPIYFAKKLGKKVFVCAQSVEPFQSNFIRNITKFVLNKVDLISVREEISLNVLNSLNIKTPKYLTADLAFLLDPESEASAKLLLDKAGVPANGKTKIGITITNWRVSESEPKNIQFVNIIKESLEKLLEEKVIIVFFPQVIFLKKEDDRILSNELRSKINPALRDNVFVLDGNYSPHQLKAMMGNMDVFIGKRLHSCIFALSMNVPSIVIGYEKKAWGIMKMLDNEDFVVDVNSMTADQLVDLVKKLLLEKKQISKHLSQKIPQIKKEAMRNGDLLEKLLKKQTTS